ncbi:hypothetical protein E2C01_019664 [Portunus trituberculatus]|uniref:Uncharacterized protein n=1 Tax=Portunus trituberculatus TaxID=210409 RepID=A0A5B7DY15_PORTR|nr:hypothetical protein [Portunus trituberculatus]
MMQRQKQITIAIRERGRTQVTLGVTLHHEVTSPLLGRRKQTHMTTFTVAITAPFTAGCQIKPRFPSRWTTFHRRAPSIVNSGC